MAPQSKMMASLRSPLEFLIQHNDIPLESKAYEFCSEYKSLPLNSKCDILKELAVKYDFDKESTMKAAESYISLQDKGTGVHLKAAERLKNTLCPSYSLAFNRIRKIDGGVKFLVDMRKDLLNILPTLELNDDSTYHLKGLNNYLKEVLSFAFNVGFLRLERITWDSSCYMLEKISEYEAVHPVRNWTDIKYRVGSYRRCYVFTHSSMPKEPIVVLHTALTNDISSDVSKLMKPIKSSKENPEYEIEDPQKIHAAIFYSITSTQKGLHGIELGNQLIKKVVQEVLSEFPHISKLSSLSPIPGFRDWFLMEIKKIQNGNSVILSYFSENDLKVLRGLFPNEDVWKAFQSLIQSNRWVNDEETKTFLQKPLMKICAHYLYTEKRRSNALNSVAHFHLRNGAVMWRLNWAADLSPRGLDNSCGMMVNYRYYLGETETNSRKYMEDHIISASDDVLQLLTPAFSKASL